MTEKEIFAKIDGYSDYAVELQTGLTAIPALSPSSGGDGEWDKAAWLEAELRKLKFDEIYHVDAPQPGAKNGLRPNIVARYKGQKGGRTLWIMSHLDVVPPGEISLWKTDPYKLARDGDLLYGRGVEDDQQGLVSSVLCLRALMELGVKPQADVALLLNADEETASVFGADHVLKTRPEIFGPNDVFIVPDGGSPDAGMVEVAEKSLFWLKIKTAGKQCHASMPHLGKNSFAAASELVFRLEKLRKKFSLKDKLFDPKQSTFESTKKEANVPNINTIPGDDVFYLDCRLLPAYSLDDLKAEIKSIASEVEKKRGVIITFETIQEAPAAPATPADSEIVRLVIEGVKKVHRKKAKPMGIGGGTVAAFFRRAGYPAAVYCRTDDTAHMPNEYCRLSNLVGDAKVFAHAALNLTA